MPHEDFDKDIEELAKEFRVTEAELLAIVAAYALQSMSQKSYASINPKLYIQIDDRVMQLQKISGEWVARVVPGVYRAGMEEAIAAAETGELKDLLRNPNHQQALNNLAATLKEDLAGATNFMGRDAKQALRNIASGNILDTLAGKKNILTGGESMRDQMLKRGVAFIDRSGRRWDPEAYARMVLRTHTAIIMNTGHLNTAADIGSPGVRVRDGGKGDTDEPCRRANGQAWGLRYAMAHRIEHPNCFPAGTIVSGPRAIAGFTRWYDGELVEVKTASGRGFTCTPNHPILTPKGWLPAGELNEGSYVFSSGKFEGITIDGRNPHDNTIPLLIEDIAESLGGTSRMSSCVMPVAAKDFHGDGRGSEVCVVRTDGLLRNGLNAEFLKPALQQPLSGGASNLSTLTCNGALNLAFDSVGMSAAGSISGSGLCLPLLESKPSHSNVHCFGCGSQLDSRGSEFLSESSASYINLISELLDRFTGEIALDAVVEVRHGLPFAGHVYNLQTVEGWYACNGIVTHNCRRAFAALTSDYKGKLDRE